MVPKRKVMAWWSPHRCVGGGVSRIHPPQSWAVKMLELQAGKDGERHTWSEVIIWTHFSGIKFSGANFCFSCLLVASCFFVLFCLCFCIMFGFSLQDMFWKKNLLMSGLRFFWGSPLGINFRERTFAFLVLLWLVFFCGVFPMFLLYVRLFAPGHVFEKFSWCQVFAFFVGALSGIHFWERTFVFPIIKSAVAIWAAFRPCSHCINLPGTIWTAYALPFLQKLSSTSPGQIAMKWSWRYLTALPAGSDYKTLSEQTPYSISPSQIAKQILSIHMKNYHVKTGTH